MKAIRLSNTYILPNGGVFLNSDLLVSAHLKYRVASAHLRMAPAVGLSYAERLAIYESLQILYAALQAYQCRQVVFFMNCPKHCLPRY